MLAASLMGRHAGACRPAEGEGGEGLQPTHQQRQLDRGPGDGQGADHLQESHGLPLAHTAWGHRFSWRPTGCQALRQRKLYALSRMCLAIQAGEARQPSRFPLSRDLLTHGAPCNWRPCRLQSTLVRLQRMQLARLLRALIVAVCAFHVTLKVSNPFEIARPHVSVYTVICQIVHCHTLLYSKHVVYILPDATPKSPATEDVPSTARAYIPQPSHKSRTHPPCIVNSNARVRSL